MFAVRIKVVMARPRYIEIAENMLGSSAYEKVNSIPNIQAEFAGILVILAGRVPPRVLKQLMSLGPKTSHFYGLPKLHKDQLALRPTVSQCNGPLTYWQDGYTQNFGIQWSHTRRPSGTLWP